MLKQHHLISFRTLLLAALCLSSTWQGLAHADSTADFNSGGLRIQLKSIHAGANYALAISSAAAKANATPIVPTVFTLEKPARIVVDIPGFPSLSAKTVDLPDGQFAAIRVGLHHDKTRLVLDLSGNELPQYSIENRAANEVNVSLNFAAAPANVEPTTNDDMVPFGEVSQEPTTAAPGDGAPTVQKTVEQKAAIAKETPEPQLALPEPEPVAPAEPAVLHAKLSTPEPKKTATGIAPPSEKSKQKRPEAEVITMVGSERIEPVDTPPKEMLKELPVEVIPSETVSNSEKTAEKVAEKSQEKAGEPKEPAASKGKHVKAAEPLESAEDLPGDNSVKEKSKPSSGPGKLSSFSFKVTDRPGKYAVQINVDQLGDYKLTRPKGDLYELVLQNTRLSGSHLTFPQFPPDEFQGFQAIAAVQRGDDVVVRIFVDDDVKLSPFRTEGQLWVQLGN